MVTITKFKPAEVKKLLVFLGTVLGNALTLGLVPDDWKVYAFLVLNTLGAYGVYKVKNKERLLPRR